jgi:ElaB/YqjD/DUF883 family membrane-anchored ribosome-binding protein
MGSTFDNAAGETKSRGLAEQSGRVLEDLRGLGQVAASSASESVRELRDQGAEALRAGRQKAVQMKDGVESSISDNPWKSVLIAAGVGALIGFALRRSR